MELLIIPASLLFIYVVVLIVHMTVHSDNYKFYKATYLAIKNKEYVCCRESHQIETYRRPSNHSGYDSDEILFFIENNRVDSIKLIGGGSNYIHSRGGIDLYTRYWFGKIMDARSENCNLYVPPTSSRPSYYESNYVVKSLKQPFKFLRG